MQVMPDLAGDMNIGTPLDYSQFLQSYTQLLYHNKSELNPLDQKHQKSLNIKQPYL